MRVSTDVYQNTIFHWQNMPASEEEHTHTRTQTHNGNQQMGNGNCIFVARQKSQRSSKPTDRSIESKKENPKKTN